MRKSHLLLAAALGCCAGFANAAVVTQSFAITATGFEAGAPIASVAGTFTFTFDNAAFLTAPAPATVSGFDVPFAGPALFSFNKNNDMLTVGNNIGFGSYTVGPATPGFGFFLSHPGGTPTISSLVYSANGQVWHSSTVNVAAVPEPAAWALMIGGLALTGGALRTARRGLRPGQVAA